MSRSKRPGDAFDVASVTSYCKRLRLVGPKLFPGLPRKIFSPCRLSSQRTADFCSLYGVYPGEPEPRITRRWSNSEAVSKNVTVAPLVGEAETPRTCGGN